jgi:pimeloyl-ACP methyl ester carboxylesterase
MNGFQTLMPASRHFFSQRLRLHYAEWGAPQAPPLLLLHGGRDHCRSWDWTAAQLQRDWHVIAPDWRGHGDSQWSADGGYHSASYVYDLAQLIYQLQLAPVTIVAHSLGGNIALRYTGIYPESVRKLVAIEGLDPMPSTRGKPDRSIDQRMRDWIEARRALAMRAPRRYASIEDGVQRMMVQNRRLTPEQARHLTVHGMNRNEDGTHSWKFDNLMRSGTAYDLPQAEIVNLLECISCPTLLVYGKQSWASNPADDGRLEHFRNAQVAAIEDAGHWVHHDQLDEFIAVLRRFL